MTTMYTVTVIERETGNERIAHTFDNRRDARRYAAMLMCQHYVREVRIYRGGPGGIRETL